MKTISTLMPGRCNITVYRFRRCKIYGSNLNFVINNKREHESEKKEVVETEKAQTWKKGIRSIHAVELI